MNISQSLVGSALAAKGVLSFTVSFAAKAAPTEHIKFQTECNTTLAGDYADTFALRGYDSIQLAAAFEAGRVAESPICFACFDTRLNKAASVLGMSCL